MVGVVIEIVTSCCVIGVRKQWPGHLSGEGGRSGSGGVRYMGRHGVEKRYVRPGMTSSLLQKKEELWLNQGGRPCMPCPGSGI